MKTKHSKNGATEPVKPSRSMPCGGESTITAMKPRVVLSELAAELQSLQRDRVAAMKSRLMMMNRLRSAVAGALDYSANMTEAERENKFKEADAIIKTIRQGGTGPREWLVKDMLRSIEACEVSQHAFEEEMETLADQLPVARWVGTIRGFGKTSRLFLAIVVGETGDLSNYANPAKVWRRMGCAPWAFGGKNLMGKTWRTGKEGKLPASEWETFGYSPRRRSIAYLIGEGLMKQNDGVYRKRYDDSKVKLKADHPDYPDQRCHLHGMLLATTMLLRDLWVEWTKPAIE